MYNKKYVDEWRRYCDYGPLWDWNLWWRGVEGFKPLNGINYLWDEKSLGFIIRIGSRGFRVRWSRRVRKLFVEFQNYNSYSEVVYPNVLGEPVDESVKRDLIIANGKRYIK